MPSSRMVLVLVHTLELGSYSGRIVFCTTSAITLGPILKTNRVTKIRSSCSEYPAIFGATIAWRIGNGQKGKAKRLTYSQAKLQNWQHSPIIELQCAGGGGVKVFKISVVFESKTITWLSLACTTRSYRLKLEQHVTPFQCSAQLLMMLLSLWNHPCCRLQSFTYDLCPLNSFRVLPDLMPCTRAVKSNEPARKLAKK